LASGGKRQIAAGYEASLDCQPLRIPEGKCGQGDPATLVDIIGENVAVFSLEHNFRDELFKLLRVPGLKDWEIQLNTYFNAVYTNVGSKTLNYLSAINYTPRMLKHPLYEIGFGIGQVLFPMQIEFTWRLNHRDENTFRVSMNSFIF